MYIHSYISFCCYSILPRPAPRARVRARDRGCQWGMHGDGLGFGPCPYISFPSYPAQADRSEGLPIGEIIPHRAGIADKARGPGGLLNEHFKNMFGVLDCW